MHQRELTILRYLACAPMRLSQLVQQFGEETSTSVFYLWTQGLLRCATIHTKNQSHTEVSITTEGFISIQGGLYG